jgi:hypothetical protein
MALAFALASAGCKRGALMEWLRQKEAAPSIASPKTATLDAILHGTDCPDGLARCLGGTVEVSRVARIPNPCPQAAEHPAECACPWDAIGTCPRGCASEGTEVVSAPEEANGRLCAPDPMNPSFRPAPAAMAPPATCDDIPPDTVRCVASLVIVCRGADTLRPSVVAACVRGCVHEGESLGEGEAVSLAPQILCAP